MIRTSTMLIAIMMALMGCSRSTPQPEPPNPQSPFISWPTTKYDNTLGLEEGRANWAKLKEELGKNGQTVYDIDGKRVSIKVKMVSTSQNPAIFVSEERIIVFVRYDDLNNPWPLCCTMDAEVIGTVVSIYVPAKSVTIDLTGIGDLESN